MCEGERLMAPKPVACNLHCHMPRTHQSYLVHEAYGMVGQGPSINDLSWGHAACPRQFKNAYNLQRDVLQRQYRCQKKFCCAPSSFKSISTYKVSVSHIAVI